MKRNRHGNARNPQKRIATLEAELASTRERFEAVLGAISSADSFEYVHRLAAAARDGLVPGEIEWSFTTRLMQHRDIRGFCHTCGAGLNGKGCELEMFEDNCPADIGILRYAGCSADA